MKSIYPLATVAFFAACITAVVPAGIDAQEPARIVVSQGVDTTDVDKKAVLDLWSEYLNARPDVMWSDQNWIARKADFGWTSI